MAPSKTPKGRETVSTFVRKQGWYPSVRSTPDNMVRVMIVRPPDEYGRRFEPTWVVLHRKTAIGWAFKVMWAAIAGAWPEHVITDPSESATMIAETL